MKPIRLLAGILLMINGILNIVLYAKAGVPDHPSPEQIDHPVPELIL